MYKISDIVSKQVITLSGAQSLGTVIDVLFSPDYRRADSLLLMDEEEDDDLLFRLPFRSGVTIGEDVAFVRSLSAPLEVFDGISASPIGKQCYGVGGKALGRLTDIELDEKFYVTALMTEKETFGRDKLVRASGALVVINDSGKEYKLPRPSVRRPKSSVGMTVKATNNRKSNDTKSHDINSEAENVVPETDTAVSQTQNISKVETATATSPQSSHYENNGNDIFQTQTAAPTLPQPTGAPRAAVSTSAAGGIVVTPTGTLGRDGYDVCSVDTPTALPSRARRDAADFAFLLGSHLTRPLYENSGRLIAPPGAKITPEVIAAAAAAGKLVQLTLRALR